jgi:D-tagatose-1,6-bisphosphate aldolase subunit GatZ/KbaZ
MTKPHPLDEIVKAQKRGEARGLPAVCSAHPWVLNAAFSFANRRTEAQHDRPLLIESTCNQVNQFGGYTGMQPADFAAHVNRLAAGNDFPPGRLVLGGDHLGPGPWQDEPASSAMQKAAGLVRACVRAGYTKLHLDASMRLGGDAPGRPLDVGLSAQRTAFLARMAEETLAAMPEPPRELRYVIGSEVPLPGGASSHEDGVHVTSVADARRTLELTRDVFVNEGLEAAWENVIALVVQPGVEFGDDFILAYDPAAARPLARFSETIPMAYEAHSTDYQAGASLRKLVRDHFAILKVGPALTFAFREAVFALAMMENELLPRVQRSRLIESLDEAMLRQPVHWQKYYRGSARAVAFARKYSLSDRCRYYWGDPLVQSAFERLLHSLQEKPLPHALLSQFMPEQSDRARNGQIPATPEALILDKIHSVLEEYALACG